MANYEGTLAQASSPNELIKTVNSLPTNPRIPNPFVESRGAGAPSSAVPRNQEAPARQS